MKKNIWLLLAAVLSMNVAAFAEGEDSAEGAEIAQTESPALTATNCCGDEGETADASEAAPTPTAVS